MSLLNTCIPESFRGLHPAFGSKILAIDAVPVIIVTANVHYGFRFVHPSITRDSVSFCNVTVTYTHYGADDEIHVEAWLPADDEWNERYYGVGGGGYAAGRFQLPYGTMTGAIAEGYAVSTTDAGLGRYATPEDASSWVLLGPGNVDLHKVQDFGSVSLHDQVTWLCLEIPENRTSSLTPCRQRLVRGLSRASMGKVQSILTGMDAPKEVAKV